MTGLVRFARDVLGIDLFPGQQQILTEWAASGKRKAVLALGRRSGKGLMAAVAAIHNATVPDYSAELRPGEQRFIVVVANRLEQAREFIRVVREVLQEAPDADLRAMVDEQATTLDSITFKTGVVIRAMPCSARSTRGLPISLLIFDELAHFVSTEDGYQAGDAIYQALSPSTAQFGHRGYIMATSSPKWAQGVFWRLYSAGMSGADDTFVVRRPTWEVNPRITRESLDADFLADPESARVEYGAEFQDGAGAFLTSEAVRACVTEGRRYLPPHGGAVYSAAIDPAFASGGDAFTLAIAHTEDGKGRRVDLLDYLEAWRGKSAPLNSDAVLDDVAGILRTYRIRSVTSDQFAVVPIADGLRKRGIDVNYQPMTNDLKADMFSTLKRAINTGSIELLDDPALVGELIGLEVRPTPGGKAKIGASRSGHDDRAMAVATAVYGLEAFEFTPSEVVVLATRRGEFGEVIAPSRTTPEPTISPFSQDTSPVALAPTLTYRMTDTGWVVINDRTGLPEAPEDPWRNNDDDSRARQW